MTCIRNNKAKVFRSCGYHLTLIRAGHLIDLVLSSEDRLLLGIKYSCFDGKRWIEDGTNPGKEEGDA